MCANGICPHEVYDSSGKLVYTWKREAASRCDTFWYYLTKPQNTLLKIHHSFRDREESKDTTIFSLDDKGRPLMGTHYSRYWYDTGWCYTDFDTIWYTYGGKLLTQKREHFYIPYDTTYNWRRTEYFYYDNGRLDSLASIQEYPYKRWKMRDIHEYVKYDERGLPLRALFADTLHVHYKFKKHGDPSIPDYSEW